MFLHVAYIFVGLVALAMGRRIIRRKIRSWVLGPETNAADQCVCGYTLTNLDTIRCPECGRVCGFNATAEDLQLTDDQLRQAKAKADARAREMSSAHIP